MGYLEKRKVAKTLERFVKRERVTFEYNNDGVVKKEERVYKFKGVKFIVTGWPDVEKAKDDCLLEIAVCSGQLTFYLRDYTFGGERRSKIVFMDEDGECIGYKLEERDIAELYREMKAVREALEALNMLELSNLAAEKE